MPISTIGAAAGVVGAGASVASALGAKSGAQTSQQSSNAPWSAQQPYLQQGFQNAQNIYNTQSQAGPYPGQYYAPASAQQYNNAGQASNFASGAGNNLAYSEANAAQTGLAAQPTYLNNASALVGSGTPGANAGTMNALNNYAQGGGLAGVQTVNGNLSSALNQAGVNGAQAINNFNSGLSGAASRAAQDPTQQIAANAGTYMNSSPVQSALNSTNAAIQQTLNEQTLPGINQAAANGGSLNSSRAGAANAMAQGQAATAMGQADSSILNNAYNQGLGVANSTYGTGLGAQIQANTAGLNANTGLAQGQQNYQLNQQQGETGTQLAAGEAGLSSQLGYNALNANTQLAANAQLGNGVAAGLQAGNAAGTTAAGNFGLGSEAGAVGQTNQQNLNNQALLQWQQANGGAALTANQNFMQQIQGNYGSTGSSTVQNPYSPISSALGAASTVGGLYANNQNTLNSLFGGSSGAPVSAGAVQQMQTPVNYGPYIGA
jgi:hypothetical protein